MIDRWDVIETAGSYRPASVLARLSRPLNSPGWGMLVAVKSGTVTGPDGEREQVKARARPR